MYMVVRYIDDLPKHEYGVSEQYQLILLTNNKDLAEKVREEESCNQEFKGANYMCVNIIEIEPEKKYGVDEEVYLGGAFYIE